MSSPRVWEKEKNARRCLAEIAIFDSVDLKTLQPQELQRFLFLAHQYSAFSTDPDLEGTFSKLQAIYNISPSLSQKIEDVIHLKIGDNPEDAMEYFSMMQRQELEAMMQAKYEQYMRSLQDFSRSIKQVFSVADKFNASVGTIGKQIFNVGATKEEIKKALSSIYATNPILAQAIIAEYYKGKDIPKEYAGFFYTPQELVSVIGGQKVDAKTVESFKKIYASNPVATVQAIEEAYTKKGLPIPAELLPFSKLPDGYSLSTGNIFVGPIRVSQASVSQATTLQYELESELKRAAEIARQGDAAAQGAKVPQDQQRENVLKGTPPGCLTGGAGVVGCHIPRTGNGPMSGYLGGLTQNTQNELKNVQRNVGITPIRDAQRVDVNQLDAIYNERGASTYGESRPAAPIIPSTTNAQGVDAGVGGVDSSQSASFSEDLGLNYEDVPVLEDEGTSQLASQTVPELNLDTSVSTTRDTTSSRHHLVHEEVQGREPFVLAGHVDSFEMGTPLSADVSLPHASDVSLEARSTVESMGDFIAEDFSDFSVDGEEEVPHLAEETPVSDKPTKTSVYFDLPSDGVNVYAQGDYQGDLARSDLENDFELPVEEGVEITSSQHKEIEVPSLLRQSALVVEDVHTSARVDDVLRDAQQQTASTSLIDKGRVG